MLMDCGEVHNTRRISAPGTFWVLMIQPGWMEKIALELTGSPQPRWKLGDLRDPGIFSLFRDLHAVLASDQPLLEKECLLVEAVKCLLLSSAERPSRIRLDCSRSALERAREYLKARACEEVRLVELAAVAGISEYHFSRCFLREFGLPPHQFQLCLRIAKAKRWLADGLPVTAVDLGFCDQPQFIRAFKKVMGVTPSRFAGQRS